MSNPAAPPTFRVPEPTHQTVLPIYRDEDIFDAYSQATSNRRASASNHQFLSNHDRMILSNQRAAEVPSGSSKKRPILGQLWSMVSPKGSKQRDQREADPQAPPLPTKLPTASAGLEQIFRFLDENGDGKISPAELQNSVRASGGTLSPEEALAAVESTDSDGDGLLGMEDFVRLVEAEGNEEEKGRNLRDAFEMYAAGEGDCRCITPKSLRRMLRRLGESRSGDECAQMIRQFDLNGDGVLSFDEFKIMML